MNKVLKNILGDRISHNEYIDVTDYVVCDVCSTHNQCKDTEFGMLCPKHYRERHEDWKKHHKKVK
jgi:hypothetical protein